VTVVRAKYWLPDLQQPGAQWLSASAGTHGVMTIATLKGREFFISLYLSLRTEVRALGRFLKYGTNQPTVFGRKDRPDQEPLAVRFVYKTRYLIGYLMLVRTYVRVCE
jgi:hypothetical protein